MKTILGKNRSRSLRDNWLASFGKDKEVYKLAIKGDVVEYLTRDVPNGDPNGRIPVYHVWQGDNWLEIPFQMSGAGFLLLMCVMILQNLVVCPNIGLIV